MKYLLKSLRFPKNDVLLDYDDESYLIGLTFSGPWMHSQKINFLKAVPVRQADLRETIGNSFHISQEMPSLEFEDFWDAFAYKVGNKKRSEKLWNAMSDVDRAACLKSIKTYRVYLVNHPKMEQCYPETFLAQRRFEAIYK